MPVTMPGEFLARCQLLDARILRTDQVIRAAPVAQVNEAFRAAWTDRLKRWMPVRLECGQSAARLWGTRWGPILEDWEANQASWEGKVSQLTGVEIPADILPHERPTDEDVSKMFEGLGLPIKAAGNAVVVAVVLVGVGLGIGAALYLSKKGGR